MTNLSAQTTLTQASRQWASRPADQRFLSLLDLQAFKRAQRQRSAGKVVSSRALSAQPDPTDPLKGLQVVGQNGTPATLSNWSFGQLSSLAGAPGGYLRRIPAPLAADCINYGLHHARDVDDVGLLLERGPTGDMVPALPSIRAATGPNYGRVWDCDLTDHLVNRFGDGITGDWRVPGEFGRAVTVTAENTTIYASDRDMFVFLADEVNRIEIDGRRGGRKGTLARGFFLSNSEVGAATLELRAFLFDYVCCNRIVWGAQNVQRIAIRHTASAPDKWLERAQPAIDDMARALTDQSEAAVVNVVAAAQARKVEALDAFVRTRFGASLAPTFQAVHKAEEDRPIETVWDVVTAATAYARGLSHQDARVDVERKAGNLLTEVSR